MNKDQAEGAVKASLGTLQGRTGRVIGSPNQEAKRLARQAEARLQKATGDVREALKNSRHT